MLLTSCWRVSWIFSRFVSSDWDGVLVLEGGPLDTLVKGMHWGRGWRIND